MTTDLIPALESERADLERRIEAIDLLLGRKGSVTTRLQEQGSGAPPVTTPPAVRRGAGVSDVKKRAVLQYVRSHGRVRQVQIQKDLNENSGAVSLAVRQLQAEGKLEDTGEIEAKSKVWKYVGPQEGSNGDRVTEIRPGEHIGPGRKR